MSRDKELLEARKSAERAVADMADGPLKIAAFQAVLSHLLSAQTLTAAPTAPVKTVRASKSGTTARLVSLLDEGLLATPRSMSEIQAALAQRGWHYRAEDLGTPLARLVRKKILRRNQ